MFLSSHDAGSSNLCQSNGSFPGTVRAGRRAGTKKPAVRRSGGFSGPYEADVEACAAAERDFTRFRSLRFRAANVALNDITSSKGYAAGADAVKPTV